MNITLLPEIMAHSSCQELKKFKWFDASLIDMQQIALSSQHMSFMVIISLLQSTMYTNQPKNFHMYYLLGKVVQRHSYISVHTTSKQNII